MNHATILMTMDNVMLSITIWVITVDDCFSRLNTATSVCLVLV